MGKHIIMQIQRYMANNVEVHLHFELQSALARWQIPDVGQAYSKFPLNFTDNFKMFTNNNEKFRSFKSKENIHKKKIGPYRGFGY